MYGRIGLFSLATAVALVLSLGAARVDASTTLGSADTSAAPNGFVCAMCPGGTSLGFVQFALRDAAVQAPEDGVLVAATVQAKRIAGGEPPRIAVLRPTEDGSASMTVVGSAPLPVSSARGSVHRVEGLHLRERVDADAASARGRLEPVEVEVVEDDGLFVPGPAPAHRAPRASP